MSPHKHEASATECADFLEQIVFLIDNELGAADVAEVKQHLQSCTPCLETYDQQRIVKAVVARSCAEVAPGDLRAKIMVQIQALRTES
ncbi:MAG: mycothiol system anti-sigma-R factor [Nocardioides sp.]|uniref:mycothiol system anti-sigma-R factor n=1 Tax=Nocardioides sp. TaxID=35761 RepID=UPI003D6B5EAB